MKKTLGAVLVALLFLVPSLSHAQTASSTEEIQAAYQATLVQLINLLQQQLVALVAQLAAQNADLTARIDAQTVAIGAVKDTVNEVKASTTSHTATGGSVDNTATPAVFEVYEVKFEDPSDFRSIYYRGNKEVSGIEIDGQAIAYTVVTKATLKPSAACGQGLSGWRCGGEFARLKPTEALSNGAHVITVISVDGERFDSNIGVNEVRD